MSDQSILTTDFNEWADYYKSKYQLIPIQLFEENIVRDLHEEKIKKYDGWNRRFSDGREYVLIDGYSVHFAVPFDGSYELLFLKPSSFLMMRFIPHFVSPPAGENLGNIVILFEYTAQELKQQADMQSFITQRFESEFKRYRDMITYVNNDLGDYNGSLRESALAQLQKRKDKTTDLMMISETLNVPLKLSGSAPNTTPIPIKRVEHQLPSKPSVKPPPKEYEITDEDYTNINDIIHMQCSSMEASARTFNKLIEEELRDVILATLNTHYDGKATGESFRRAGKTDIYLPFEKKAAYIGECKIWHGEKKFCEAIHQLFSYSTWKDTKTSLIVFNKDNRDFTVVRNIIDDWVSRHSVNYQKTRENSWQCKLLREGSSEHINVNISIFNFYLDN